MAESELDRAAREYASQASPFAGLQDFLLNRPVFDRGPAPTPTTPTLRTLDFADDAAQNQARQYREMLAEQKAQQDACCTFYHHRKHSKRLAVLSVMIESTESALLCFLS